jgi:argininosuccinate synthase
MPQLIDNLDDLRRSVRSCLTLYSGGLDSSWFLHWARQQGIRATALHVHLSEGEPDPEISRRAVLLGADYRVLRLTDEFARGFIAPAIQANALYQGAYPVCSSLSRPLIAEAAVRMSRAESLDCIVHTTTFVQNSAARFNNSIKALAPDVVIANPLIREPIRREEKQRHLAAAGVEIRQGLYSVDENIWGRVIECGELDDPANIVPSSIWAPGSEAPPAAAVLRIKLEFESGLPVAMCGQRLSLEKIILRLNEAGARYRVGRYNGLEDALLGIKNHEVRESPAAAAILAAHAALERAVLTQREIRVKAAADWEWTELVTNGFWHSPLRESLGALIASLSRLVAGEVVLEYTAGNVFVSAIRSPRAPHFWNVADIAESLLADFSYQQYFELESLPLRLRTDIWQPAQSMTETDFVEQEL